jgi:hypothetical protein
MLSAKIDVIQQHSPRIYFGFAMANSWIKHLSNSQALLRDGRVSNLS